jgi:hypothetical protein
MGSALRLIILIVSIIASIYVFGFFGTILFLGGGAILGSLSGGNSFLLLIYGIVVVNLFL